LFVSTTGTDSDYIVKVIDVHPSDGYEELVRADVMRAKFRKSFEHPDPMAPAEITPIGFSMPDVFHAFLTGHRIKVQIQRRWFLLVERHPQSHRDMYHLESVAVQSATQRVYHSASHSSRVIVGVVTRGNLGEVVPKH